MPKGKVKLSCKKKAAILKDEREAIEMYGDLGFPRQAADEAKHLEFFRRQPCRR